MSKRDKQNLKDRYRELRRLAWDQLWLEEVPRFDRFSPEERLAGVALVRAVGVVFSESGPNEQREAVRSWLTGLLRDPQEKVRRYAMAAIPKVGGGSLEEAGLLTLLRESREEREREHLCRALEKIGGSATLQAVRSGQATLPNRSQQKIQASLARDQHPSSLCLDRALSPFEGLRLHLRGRRGMEGFVRDELEHSKRLKGRFRIEGSGRGRVTLTALAPFSLADLYSLRCFESVGFVLGRLEASSAAVLVEGLAGLIAAGRTRTLLEVWTEGSVRYRLEMVGRGHQRGLVRRVAERAYALCPDILNDPRQAPWEVSVRSVGTEQWVELSPRLTPDPRFAYRCGDIPAASHPQLAAAMARLAGSGREEVVWDPFCGSGLELVERALLGGVRSVLGTDLSEEALTIARENFSSANLKPLAEGLVCSDFRDFAGDGGLDRGSVSLILTNPPLGRRVPVPDLPGLIRDLYYVADRVLRPGGRLVFANPFRRETPVSSLKLAFRQVVDFGGFDCRVEKYIKQRA